jgi:hypothetical protein
MERDFVLFPSDENGDVLWHMAQHGVDFSDLREIDFSVIFPTKENALRFAVMALQNDEKVSFSSYEGNKDFPWQVQLHPVMEPTHQNISEFEAMLEGPAASLGGKNDGWGFEH